MIKLHTLLALAAVLTAPALVRADTDAVSGSWNVNGKVEGFAVKVRCDFLRHGDAVDGRCQDGEGGAVHTLSTGSVHGDQITWTYKSRFLLKTFEPRYSGTLDGASIKGAIAVAGHKGQFVADRS